MVAAAAALILIHLALAILSTEFGSHNTLENKPIVALVALELLAGAVWLAAVHWGRRAAASRAALLAAVVVGIILRATMLFSTPMLEDDYFRYLWDGAVTVNGINPYRYAPQQVIDTPDAVPPLLRRLARESGEVIECINYPSVRTIYPPAAQVVFAATYLLGPWSILSWRLVLALFDAAVLVMLFAALRELKLPPLLVVVYWWNPLVVKEIFNSGHMDVISLPFTLAALLLAVRDRPFSGAAMLAVGAATKLWPVVALPHLLARLRRNVPNLASAAALFALVFGALSWPILFTSFDPESGFRAYGTSWERNDALFMTLSWIVKSLLTVASIDPGWAALVSRALVCAALAAWLLLLIRKGASSATDLWEHCLLSVAALFLLSPTQFPWYYVWVIPFLVIRPRLSLLVLSALLPIFNLSYYFAIRGHVEFFYNYVVWLQYVPVWALLVWEWTAENRSAVPRGGDLTRRQDT